MFKSLVRMIGHFGERLEASGITSLKQLSHAPWREMGLPEQHSPDFRPELKQEFSINDCIYPFYVSPIEVDRTYMPFRFLRPEVNTKYMGQILKILNKYTAKQVR